MEVNFDDLLSELLRNAEEDGELLFSDDDLYAFEFSFLPSLVETNWVDSHSREAALGDPLTILDQAMRNNLYIDPIHFHAHCIHHDSLEIYAYDFPTPPRAPFALRGVVIYSHESAWYYTLEKSHSGYMFCGTVAEIHFNYGPVEELSRDDFVKLCIEHYLRDAG